MSLTWLCPKCQEELGELNGYCVYCKINFNETIYNPDKYYVRDVFVRHIGETMTKEDEMSQKEFENKIDSNNSLTAQEKLFSKLFYHEKLLVRDMNILELRAHREELGRISFEARARHTAATDEEDKRSKKNEKTKGFERSLNTDEATTDAINTIKERQKRLTGKEKIRQTLVKLFMTSGMTQLEAEKEADQKTGAAAILTVQEDKKEKKNLPPTTKQIEISKPVFNPFEKK